MANHAEKKLPAYLSSQEAGGLAFGCSIGWGCFKAGLNAHLLKPVEPERLYSTLESLIH